MSEALEPDREAEAKALAHAFARTLAHLREFRGLRYVGAAPLPSQPDEVGLNEVPADAPGDAPGRPESSGAPISEPLNPGYPLGAPTPNQRPPVESLPNHQSSYSRPDATIAGPAIRHGGESRPAASPPARGQPRLHREPPREPPREPGAERWPAAKKLSILREQHVADCQGCRLAQTRNSIVFGVGDPDADIMFIGEAPGADEDRLSEPFVGLAGQRLDRWIEHFGLRRREVYIANVLKCRPPNNRDPEPDEVDACSKFLRAQIRAIQPKVLIALGRVAGKFLLGADLKLFQMRGKVHRYREPRTGVEIPVIVTFHPSYVLRSEKQVGRGGVDERRPDHDGAIKSEDEKVLADIGRAISLARGRA